MKRQHKLRSIKDKRKNVIKLRHPVAPPTRSYDPRRYNRSKEKQQFLQDLKEVCQKNYLIIIFILTLKTMVLWKAYIIQL